MKDQTAPLARVCGLATTSLPDHLCFLEPLCTWLHVGTMTKHLRFALVAGTLAAAMVVVDELFDMGTIGFAGVFVMGLACGIWLGGQLK